MTEAISCLFRISVVLTQGYLTHLGGTWPCLEYTWLSPWEQVAMEAGWVAAGDAAFHNRTALHNKELSTPKCQSAEETLLNMFILDGIGLCSRSTSFKDTKLWNLPYQEYD